MLIRYLSHPQVRIDPDTPVPQWGLSEIGAMRVEALTRQDWLASTVHIISSAETKAMETAQPLADVLNITLEIREKMHENDRSATGFLPPDKFEKIADAFFAEPTKSILGWERAIDAQQRIVDQTQDVLDNITAEKSAGDLLFVGHGAVGTLLYCHYAGVKIDRKYDQSGGGNYFTIDSITGKALHGWRPMEQPPV